MVWADHLRIAALTLAAVIVCSQTHAAWRIDAAKDRMTDSKVVFATLAAKEISGGVSASLHLGCVRNIGVVEVNALLSSRLTQGAIRIAFRVDDGPTNNHASFVGSTSQSVQVRGFNGEMMRGGKRFRLQLFPFGSVPLFYDFDITGVDAALKAINCRRPA